MREIKFRVWDKAYKAWIDDFEVSADGNPFWLDAEGGVNSLGEVELMQSTGLKDKNGVDIYEGDIVKTNFKTGEVIRYCEWNFTAVGFMFGGWQYTSEDMLLTQVIGNIYENPELLK